MIQRSTLTFLFASALAAGTVLGQSHQHTFLQPASTLDQAQLKQVIQAVADAHPNAAVFASDDLRVLQIKHGGTITETGLRQLITATGVSLLPGTPDLKDLYGEAPDVPMYVPTGDPEGDHLRYKEAVEAYNEANPDKAMPTPIPPAR